MDLRTKTSPSAAVGDPDIRHISHPFNPGHVESSCYSLVKGLSPEWTAANPQHIQYQAFTEGITNTLIKVTNQRLGQSQDDADREAVLVRVYGNGTDTMIDRAKELRVHKLLAENGLAAPVIATFENGFMCGFVPGKTCEVDDFHDLQTARAMARRLGHWHASLPISALASDGEAPPNIWTNASKWIELLPADTAQLKERNKMFRSELSWLFDLLAGMPGLDGKDMVFSHTDLLCGNVIIEPDKKTRQVTFIDYEYATAAPPAFDIANVFAEWAGPEGDLSLMPSQSQRRNFITHYVESFRLHNGDATPSTSTEDAINQLYNQVDLFRGLPGFYWGIWG